MPKPTIIAKATRRPETERRSPSAVAQIWGAMADMVRRIAALEGRSVPEPVDLDPLQARVDSLFAALAERRDPPAVDEAAIERIVDARVAAAIAALPEADVDLSPLTARVDGVYAALAARPSVEAEKVDYDQLRQMVTDEVSAQMPEPIPAREVDMDAVARLVVDEVAKIKRPTIDMEAVGASIEDAVARRIAAIDPPEDGIGVASALIDRDGNLTVTATNGSVFNLGRVVGSDADPDAVRAMVADAVVAAVAAIPHVEPPEPKDVDPVVLAAIVSKAVANEIAKLPQPEGGQAITIDDVRPLVDEAVQSAIAGLPEATDGVSIVDTIVNGDGRLQVILSDSRRVDAGRVVPDAVPGPAGRSVAGARITDDGNLVLSMSEGEDIEVGCVKGEPGESVRGDDGRGVAEMVREGDELVAVFTDGERASLGRIRGEDGKPGKPGRPGAKVKGDPGATLALINFTPADLAADDLDSLFFADLELSDGSVIRVITRN